MIQRLVLVECDGDRWADDYTGGCYRDAGASFDSMTDARRQLTDGGWKFAHRAGEWYAWCPTCAKHAENKSSAG